MSRGPSWCGGVLGLWGSRAREEVVPVHVVVWMFVIPVSLPWLFKPLKKKQSAPFSRGAAHNFKGSSELPSANNGRLPAPAAL